MDYPKKEFYCVHKDTLSCEPIVRRMPDGELLMVFQCHGAYEPCPDNRVLFAHSEDDGAHWTRGVTIYPEDGNAVYCTEVMVIGQEITAFLTLHNGQFFDWRSVRMVSHDSGHTWENAGPCPGLETYTFVRGMIRLENGTIVIPFHKYPVTPEDNARFIREWGGKKQSNGRLCGIFSVPNSVDHVENGVLVSRDGGKTYEKHLCPDFPIFGDTGRPWIWTEPTVVELSDHRIAMLIRVVSGVLWYSESADDGKTWTPFVPTDIPNPCCKPKLIRLDGGRIALLHDPNEKKRNPFALWISDDDMKTWREKYIVSDFPLTWDYPDGFYENGKLYLSIELQRRDVIFIRVTL